MTTPDIVSYLRAGYPALMLRSYEEQRAQLLVKAATRTANRKLFVWTTTDGLIDPETAKSAEKKDPLELCDFICSNGFTPKSVILAKDLHVFLRGEPNPILLRRVKDAIIAAKAASSCLILVGVGCPLPPELEKEIAVLDLPLPDEAALKELLNGIVTENELPPPDAAHEPQILRAACGLTTYEAENALSLSLVSKGAFDARVIAAEKAQTIRKNGLLEMQDPPGNIDAIGGLEVLKEWLLARRDNFSAEAREYGLDVPKGVLLFGPPGTGKSLTAKITAAIFGNVPLLRCDVGAIFGSLVGESEKNMRTLIETCEAVAPCVVMIDEIDKAFTGTKSSGSTDGGTGARVFATMLQWMNDKTKEVFVVATANHPTMLDAALLRKGRWDEIFFVDLPNPAERGSIWRIHLAKKKRDAAAFDIDELVRLSDGYTGAEIETVLKDAMTNAFADGRRPVANSDIAWALSQTMPVSKLMAEEIRSMRDWANGRARPASKPAPVVVETRLGSRRVDVNAA